MLFILIVFKEREGDFLDRDGLRGKRSLGKWKLYNIVINDFCIIKGIILKRFVKIELEMLKLR